MMLSKRGQGLSLTTIIVAALALIVLVVLVAVFINQIGKTESGINRAGEAELVKLKIQYRDCRPTATEEGNFLTQFNRASEGEKEGITEIFEEEIDRCSILGNEAECEAASCKWR